MTVLRLFNRCFYFYEDTPSGSCLYQNDDTVIRHSTDITILCAPLKCFAEMARGGEAIIVLVTVKKRGVIESKGLGQSEKRLVKFIFSWGELYLRKCRLEPGDRVMDRSAGAG